MFETIAEYVGFSPSHLTYVTCMLLAYPAARVFRTMSSTERPWAKHLWALCTGFALGWLCFGLGEMLSTLFMVVCTFYAVLWLGHHPLTPYAVFAVTMLHLAYRQWTAMLEFTPGTLNATGLQMILATKLISFAWNVHDGQRLARTADTDAVAMAPELRLRALPIVPSLLEFGAYVYFFGSLLAGPSHDYFEYRHAFVARKQMREPEPLPRRPSDESRNRSPTPFAVYEPLPDSTWPALKRLLVGLACVSGILLASRVFPMSYARTTLFRTETSFLFRFMYVQIAAVLARFQYYFAWKVTEGSCVMAGMGYNGIMTPTDGGADEWTAVENVNITALETSTSFKGLVETWNKSINTWLRFYVYWRVCELLKNERSSSSRATLVTYVVSAVWHGFYFGYYSFFISAALITIVNRAVRLRIRPKVLAYASRSRLPVKTAYDVVGWAFSQMANNYIAAGFVLLSARDCFVLYTSLGFCIHVGAAVLLFAVVHWVPVASDASVAPAVKRDEDVAVGPIGGSQEGVQVSSDVSKNATEVHHRRPAYSPRVRNPNDTSI